MTKRQIIDEILTINPTAKPAFLARFEDAELGAYLSHLQVLARPRLTGDASRFEKYFINVPKIPFARPQWRTTPAADAAQQAAADAPAATDAPPAPAAEYVAVAEPAEQHADTWVDADEVPAVAQPAAIAPAPAAQQTDDVEDAHDLEVVGRGLTDNEDGLDYRADIAQRTYAAPAAAPAAEDDAPAAFDASDSYEELAAAESPAVSAEPEDADAADADETHEEHREPALASATAITAARASGPLFVAARQQEVEAYLY